MIKLFLETVHKLPVTMKNLIVELYNIDKKPSCLKGSPNVVLPGFAKLSDGNPYEYRYLFDIISIFFWYFVVNFFYFLLNIKNGWLKL